MVSPTARHQCQPPTLPGSMPWVHFLSVYFFRYILVPLRWDPQGPRGLAIFGGAWRHPFPTSNKRPLAGAAYLPNLFACGQSKTMRPFATIPFAISHITPPADRSSNPRTASLVRTTVGQGPCHTCACEPVGKGGGTVPHNPVNPQTETCKPEPLHGPE